VKLKIQKRPDGAILVEYSPSPSAKPVVVRLEPAQWQLVRGVLDAAQKADRFEFELEL
jgi:hypothetical protein